MATGSSPTTAAAPPPVQPDVIPAREPEEEQADDADSAYAESEVGSSTASISSSILEYRTLSGRTFHSDRHPSEYFTPNDEQQSESVDLTHHYLTLLLDGRLHLAPTGDDVQSVLDVGTGTGIWAIDFADEHPNAEVTGSDLSPIQPQWVPPNVKFEIDDASLSWNWKENSYDLVHLRYLFGSIMDWPALMKEAYRVTKPGGYVHSCECDVKFLSDDGTTAKEPVLETWNKLYEEGGKKRGASFEVVKEDLQRMAIAEAGFEDIQVVNYKIPVGPWARDPKLADVGRFVKLTLENDIEGYTLLMWTRVLKWPADEYQIFLMEMRRVLRSRAVHSYMSVRYVYGRKPGGAVPT